jgi:hypothetical protein
MADLLFLVHGMGVHGEDWAESTIQQLRALPDEYGYARLQEAGGIESRARIVPITYDAAFDRLRADWGTSAQALRETAQEHGIGIPNVLGWLERASEIERNFFWTHVVDVLLYRFFAIVTAEVRTRVRHALVQEIEPAMAGGEIPRVSVLAHSLGTAVTHDALALLGSQPLDGNEAFMTGRFKLASLFMVSNVSRVLETSPAVFRSVVHPDTAGSGDAYLQSYYDIRHRLDPIAAVRAFAPVGWGDGFVAVDDCQHVLDFNVHDLGHYLDDPRVHIRLFRAVAGRRAVSPEEQEAALAAYDAKQSPPCAAELSAFRTTVQRLISVASVGADPETLVIAGSQFLAAAREARDACR